MWNPLLVSHLKLKKLFNQPQIKNQDRTSFHEYQHQLKCSNNWFLSIGYYDTISSTENLTKSVKRLANYLRQKFYESTRDYDSENVVTLIKFEKWLQIRTSHLFNPIANIIGNKIKRCTRKQNQTMYHHMLEATMVRFCNQKIIN